jgi:tRNA dimethylallyltransferase
MHTPSVVILTGATASGKSALALDYAYRTGGVIINADSMQIYGDAPLLTAQPRVDEQASIPHRLYGVRDAAIPCCAMEWVQLASAEIRACWQLGALPIVVGGTGMYIHALMHGMSSIPAIPDPIRAEVRALPHAALRGALEMEDSRMAAVLMPHDSQRNARALEVMRATGRSLAAWQQDTPQPPLPEASFTLYCTQLNRIALYERINARTEAMLAAGGLQEATALHARGLPRSLPLLRAVGIAELLIFLDGDASWEDTVEAMARNTRRYAKRQLTWSRNQWPEARSPYTLLD